VTSSETRADFKETRDRKIDRQYPSMWNPGSRLQPIDQLAPDSRPEAIMKFGYRAFDPQFCIADNRVSDYMRIPLWQSWSKSQVFLTSLLTKPLGAGPAAVATSAVPDLDYFSGRGAKDVIPLYRTSSLTPNMDGTVLTWLQEQIAPQGVESAITAIDIFKYCYAILAGSDYTSRFAENLQQPGPRIPITRNPDLFVELVKFGEKLIAVHTFGEVHGFPIPQDATLNETECTWLIEPTRLPMTPRDFNYDLETQTLKVGDGILRGVSPDVWDYEVSGLAVVKKWLGYRTSSGSGRATTSSSSLDRLRSDVWPSQFSGELARLITTLQITVDMAPEGVDLMNQVLAGEIVTAEGMPHASDFLRLPPQYESESQGLIF